MQWRNDFQLALGHCEIVSPAKCISYFERHKDAPAMSDETGPVLHEAASNLFNSNAIDECNREFPVPNGIEISVAEIDHDRWHAGTFWHFGRFVEYLQPTACDITHVNGNLRNLAQQP